MKSTPKNRLIHQWSNKWPFFFAWVQTWERGRGISNNLSTYWNILWRWVKAGIIDLSIFLEFRLSFVLNYVWWRRGQIFRHTTVFCVIHCFSFLMLTSSVKYFFMIWILYSCWMIFNGNSNCVLMIWTDTVDCGPENSSKKVWKWKVQYGWMRWYGTSYIIYRDERTLKSNYNYVI